MSAQHTAGPWSLETVKTSSGICHKVGPFPWRDGKENHACIYVDYPNGAMGPVEAELKANARLIAAAPELLAALNFFVAFHDESHEGHRDLLDGFRKTCTELNLPLSSSDLLTGLIGGARLALSRALGEGERS